MTTSTRVPTDITEAGVAQTTYMIIPTDTVYFTPSGSRDFIRIINGSAAGITATITHQSHCNMDVGHDFVMTVGAVGTAPANDLTFVIPYIDHYIATDGTIAIVFSAKTDVLVGIFRMPAYQ